MAGGLPTALPPLADRATILNAAERERLIYLLDLQNDLNVTQLDNDELAELRGLLAKLAS